MKLDILVRIGGFHLRAGAETSPGLCHARESLLDVGRRCSREYEENQLCRISVPA
jgi:hypothetical protein